MFWSLNGHYNKTVERSELPKRRFSAQRVKKFGYNPLFCNLCDELQNPLIRSGWRLRREILGTDLYHLKIVETG